MLYLTIILFIISPLLSLFFVALGIQKDKKNRKLYILILASVYAFIAYNYAPIHDTDLTRYYIQLETYSNLSIRDLLDFIINNGFNFGRDIIFWAVSQTGNYSLLQVIPTFLTYYSSFMIIDHYSTIYMDNDSNYLFLVVIALLLLPFSSIVNNVRNVMAFSLSIIILMKYDSKKFSLVWLVLLSLFAMTVHVTSILVFILYLVPRVVTVKALKSSKIYLVIVMIGVISLRILEPIMSQFSYYGNIVSRLIYTINAHFNKSGTLEIYRSNSLGVLLRNSYYLLVVTILFISLWKSKKKLVKYSEEHVNSKRLLTYITYLQLISLIIFVSFTLDSGIYNRFLILLFQLVPVYLVCILNPIVIKGKNISKLFVLIIAVLSFIVDVAYLSRMVNLNDFILSLFF